jgi:hypothetical protein
VGAISLSGIALTAYLVRQIPDSAITFLQAVLESKQGSAEGHLFPWAELAPRWVEWIFTGSSTYSPYEFWWPSALVNFGAPWFFVDFAIVTLCIVYLGRSFIRADVKDKPIYSGLFLYGCYFFVGSFNLPFSQVFPINVLFFVFSFLVVFAKIRPESYT